MPLASGINEQLIFVPEVTQGVTPATPAFSRLLLDGRQIQGAKAALQSPSVINNGQAGNTRQGFKTIGGSTPFTLRYENFDDLFELHMGGTWTAGVAPAAQGDLVVATTSTITSVGATFITDGYEVGDIVDLTWPSQPLNDLRTTILGVAAGTLTFPPVLTTIGADAAATIHVVGEKLKVGTTLRTWTVERGFVDANPLYFSSTGASTSDLSLSITTGANVTGSASWVGMNFADGVATSLVTTLSGSLAAVTERNPISAIETTSRLFLGTAQISRATAVDFSLARPRAGVEVVFANSSPGIFDADIAPTGNLNFLLDSADAEYTKFYNETGFTIHTLLFDQDGTNFIKITVPNAIYSNADIQTSAGAGPVPQNMPWVANRDTVSGSNFTMQKGNV